MIYSFPGVDEPIKQGDIFTNLPRLDISLSRMVLAEGDGEDITNWGEIAHENKPVGIIVPVRPVVAIVATQDCDAIRSRDITLCEIRSFGDVEKKCKETKSPKSWKNIITQQARINLKWFYLPPDSQIGFKEKMAVEFMVTLRLPREDLEGLRSLRRGRLNDIAEEHFRERIGEFYRRYPYDEWYPLDKEELEEYRKESGNVEAFPWQQ